MTKKLSETERHQDLAPLLAKGWTAVKSLNLQTSSQLSAG